MERSGLFFRMVFLYITCKNHDEAKRIGRQLIKQRAAGCVNILPIASLYSDKDQIIETEEVAMIVKTIDSKIQEVEYLVRQMHGYKTPCIAAFALHRLNREFKEWLTSCVA